MHRKYFVIAAVFSLITTGALMANHHTYVNAMKAAANVTGPTGKALEGGDMDTVKKNAGVMARNFTIMAAWWEGRGSSSAFNMSEAAAKASRDLRTAANAGDAAAANAAFGEIRGSCKSCHTAHRVKNADGSWGFKD